MSYMPSLRHTPDTVYAAADSFTIFTPPQARHCRHFVACYCRLVPGDMLLPRLMSDFPISRFYYIRDSAKVECLLRSMRAARLCICRRCHDTPFSRRCRRANYLRHSPDAAIYWPLATLTYT